MPQCSKNVQFSDISYLAQTLYSLLRFLPQLFQLSTCDWTMRGHWQWPEGCWLQGQPHLLGPTSPPVHVELFGTFKYYRENTGHGASGKPWGHIYKDAYKLTFGQNEGWRRVAESEERTIWHNALKKWPVFCLWAIVRSKNKSNLSEYSLSF